MNTEKNKQFGSCHLLITIVLGLSCLPVIVQAQESSDIELNSSEVEVFPYEKTFTITAYYSPIEGQQRYIRGSLEADKKLNGNGTNGADGTPVFPGMIAAPKSIPFETKMLIPGIGTVAVHDRGGAIVPAGQRGQKFDRLDVWMGKGDEGLNRALRWGKRNVKVIVYGVDDSIEEHIDISGISGDAVSEQASVAAKIFRKDFGLGDQDAEISEIKRKLGDLKYYAGEIDNDFNAKLYDSVIKFQLDYEIIDNSSEFGAGYFGPQTRITLEKALQGLTPSKNHQVNLIPTAQAKNSDPDLYSQKVLLAGNGLSFLGRDLTLGDSGQAVLELQIELKKLNLFGIEPTGYYGEVTAHAVYKFQQIQGLVGDESSPGAGAFGPLTRNKISALVDSRIETRRIMASKDDRFLAKK